MTVAEIADQLFPYLTMVEGLKLAKDTNCFKYLECSALTHKGLNRVFTEAVEAALAPKPRSGKGGGGGGRRGKRHCSIL